MTSLTTFYLSRLLGCNIFDARDNILGRIQDVYVRIHTSTDDYQSGNPEVIGFAVRVNGKNKAASINKRDSFSSFFYSNTLSRHLWQGCHTVSAEHEVILYLIFNTLCHSYPNLNVTGRVNFTFTG